MKLDKSDLAIMSYDKCTALDPTNVDGWNQKGLVLMSLGRYQDALLAYDKATGITVKNAEVWNNKGLAYVALGKYGDALQSFNKALGLQPDFAEALKNKNSVMGKQEGVLYSGTVTPKVTVSSIATLVTTVPISVPPTQATSLVTTQVPVSETTNPVATKTTYSPVSPITALAAAGISAGIIIMIKRAGK
jgi:tetratricopeptide (TPR) repeat protein